MDQKSLPQTKDNSTLKDEFLSAKQVEGCSLRSINYYSSTLDNLIKSLEKPFNQVETEDLRSYLSEYQKRNDATKQTIDNIRRILSSFFTWLEDEDYILKSPVRRIHKIKTTKQVKETYSDEALERLRDNCKTIRDLAIIDILSSTGMRVGELVKLNRVDVDFNNRECVVLGKGSKETCCIFDARTKLHLQNYLNVKKDEISRFICKFTRTSQQMEIAGIEISFVNLEEALELIKFILISSGEH